MNNKRSYVTDSVYLFPTSYTQQGIWVINQMNPNNIAYCLPYGYKINGALNTDKLHQAINTLVQRHEIFRTNILLMDGELCQVVKPSLSIDMPIIDLSDCDEAIQKQMHDEVLNNEKIKPFDLAKDSLLRIMLIKLDTDEFTLFFNFHHIIVDQQAIAQFAQELNALYADRHQHLLPPANNTKLHYGDYCVWQQKWQSPEQLSQGLHYWQEQKSQLDEVLKLPTDQPRSIQKSFSGAESPLHIPLELTKKLRQLSRDKGVTLFVLTLAVFKVLLHRYSGQNTITVGCPYANRGIQTELEQVMGCFINTLPLSDTIDADATFSDFLNQVKNTAFNAQSHQDVPFELIVEHIQPKRDPSYNPLFQVAFMLQEGPMNIVLADTQTTPLYLHNNNSKFDITLWLWETENGLQGLMEYNDQLWRNSTIQRLIGHYQTLLQAIASNPNQNISNLNILPRAEKKQLLVEWNNTATDPAQITSFVQAFEQQAASSADKVALIVGTLSVTYKALNQQANQLAHTLVDAGIGANTVVGVYLERSVKMLASLLAILKAGGAYLPLDPSYPAQRINFIIEDSGVEFIVTQATLIHQLPQEKITFITPETTTEETNFSSQIKADSLAYIIYTSGSTGQPKGVETPHRAVNNFIASMQQTLGIHADDTLLALTTISFDISVLEIFLPLSVGAKVILATREEAADGEQLKQLIEKHAVSIMQATPTSWRLLLASDWAGADNFKALCGGEALPADIVPELLSHARAGLWNMYGPTETTVWSSCYRLENNTRLLIGKPIANTTFYILDEQLQPCPIGIAGELYIGGMGLAQGYRNQAALTAARFIGNPFSALAEAKIYKTGDMARYHHDGNVQCLGRRDEQIKLRGFRIELGEIESALMQHADIKQAVVSVKEVREGDKRLVAYTIFETGKQLTVSELRHFLREQLPDYMVPSLYVNSTEFTTTASGKIDRKALANPFAHTETREAQRPPKTAAEKIISQLWQTALKQENISTQDNFFELGGHSLLAMQVIHRIKQETGNKISSRAMIMDSLEQIAATCQIEIKPQKQNDSLFKKIKRALSKLKHT